MPDRITGDMLIREVTARYRGTEGVFARHGLDGCGGPQGPLEPIEFFARVHRVDVEQLLRDLNDFVAGKELLARPEPQFRLTPISNLHKPFLYASLIVALTAGAGLGAINLLHMASQGLAVTVWPVITQLHAHSQIMGWVGLFIMGVAYTIVPRLKGVVLPRPGLARLSLGLVLGGLGLRLISQPWALSLGSGIGLILSGLLEVAGVSLFAGIIFYTLAKSQLPAEGFERYIRASLVWFWLGTAGNLALLIFTVQQGANVAPEGFQSAYFTSQLWGFMALMVLAIGQRVHPDFLGIKAPPAPVLSRAFWFINGGLALLVGGEVAQAFHQARLLDYIQVAGAVATGGGLIAFLHTFNPFQRAARDLRGMETGHIKFIKTAYGWLFVASLMAIGYSIYQAVSAQPVPYFWTGALRHALAVGFITTLILGQASRIVPVFAGNRLYSAGLLGPVFWLITVGTAMRVGGQISGGLWGGASLAIMGLSGWLQWAALGLFGYNLWRTMEKPALKTVPEVSAMAFGKISKDMIVGEVLDKYPQALEVFLRYGFAPLANPLARQTMAKSVTIAQAAQIHSGIDLAKLVEELNRVCA